MKCVTKGILLIMFLFPVVLFSEDANVSDNKYKELKEFQRQSDHKRRPH
jgi:hypothetical protein